MPFVWEGASTAKTSLVPYISKCKGKYPFGTYDMSSASTFLDIIVDDTRIISKPSFAYIFQQHVVLNYLFGFQDYKFFHLSIHEMIFCVKEKSPKSYRGLPLSNIIRHSCYASLHSGPYAAWKFLLHIMQ